MSCAILETTTQTLEHIKAGFVVVVLSEACIGLFCFVGAGC